MACRTCDIIRGILMSENLGELPQNVALQVATERFLDPQIEKIEDFALSKASKGRKTLTKYQRAYKRRFNQIKRKYTTKSGKWVKGGFSRAVRAAHKEAKKDTSPPPKKKTKGARR